MKNIYFPDEEITRDDVFFVCSLIERTARSLKQPNRYVANSMGVQALRETLSVANVLHSENPEAVTARLIERYRLEKGHFDVSDMNPEYCPQIPTPLDMGKVYMRLVLSTLQPDEDYAQAIIRVYNHPICQTLDNYNASGYYEPSYYITRSYYNGTF